MIEACAEKIYLLNDGESFSFFYFCWLGSLSCKFFSILKITDEFLAKIFFPFLCIIILPSCNQIEMKWIEWKMEWNDKVMRIFFCWMKTKEKFALHNLETGSILSLALQLKSQFFHASRRIYLLLRVYLCICTKSWCFPPAPN